MQMIDGIQSNGFSLSLAYLQSSHGCLSAFASTFLLVFISSSIILTKISIRFRAAWKAQGHSLDELPFKAMGGIWGSWFGVILNGLVLIAQFYVVRIPPSPCDTSPVYVNSMTGSLPGG